MREASMRVRFHGAAGEVTGSLHRLEYDDKQVLLDCGLIQGGGNDDARNAAGFGFDPRQLDAVVVSHAHIDHCGRLPLLVKRGYTGPIYMTAATADLLRIMLEDSARLASADAERETRARQRRGEGKVEPLFLLRDVIDTIKQVRPLHYGERREILPGLKLRFEDAGHIIGAAIVELVREQAGKRKTLVFSGDIGPNAAPILRDPTPMHEADLLLMESTYGDRCHRNRADTVVELGRVLRQAREDGGNVLIPAFAVGRTQEILYWMARYFRDWELEHWQINLDSPMALKVTELYQRHVDLFDREAKELLAKGLNPFAMPNLRLISDVQDSMALNKRASGQIIIAGSGMCTGGRIKHHLRHNLWRENSDVVFVGYQAARTLGRQLVDGAEFVTIYGEKIKVRARRHTVGGLSAHADQNQLAAWYGHFHGRPPVALIHGEDKARRALKEKLETDYGAKVRMPKPGQVAKF